MGEKAAAAGGEGASGARYGVRCGLWNALCYTVTQCRYVGSMWVAVKKSFGR